MARTRTDWLRWGVRARRHPSAFLLAAQLVSLILYPLFDEMRGGRVLFGALGVVVLMLAVWVVERSPAKVWIAWLLVVPALLLSVASVVLGSDNLLVLSSALEALLYLYAAASLIAYMLGDHRVTARWRCRADSRLHTAYSRGTSGRRSRARIPRANPR